MSLPPAGAPPDSGRPPLALMAIGLLVGLLAGLAVFVGLPEFSLPSATQQGGTLSTPATAPIAGAPAPDFSLRNLDGEMVALSDLKGRVVMLNFWATWCGPCRVEMPYMQAKHDALESEGLSVVAVNLDESHDLVSAFVDELGLSFTTLLDPGGAVNSLYRVRGYPTTFFINRDGMIDRQHIGVLTEGQLNDYLARLGLID